MFLVEFRICHSLGEPAARWVAHVKSTPLPSGLFRLLRPWRPFDRRQRLYIVGNRRLIGLGHLRGVPDHTHHRTAGGIAVGRLPALEKISDVFIAPLADSLLSDVGHPALAFGIGSAGKTLCGNDAAEKIARGMTLGAMAEPVDEIS